MKKALVAACFFACAIPAHAQSLGGILRSLDRAAYGTRAAPTQVAAGNMLVAPSAEDTASMKVALDRAVAAKTPAAMALASARPVVERLLMTMGCATSAKALNGLNRERLQPQTYRSVDDDLNYTAMGLTSSMTHDRRQCMQVMRVSELQRPRLNSLSLRTYFVSPSSGEARNVVTSFRLVDGSWLIDRIGWFQRN